MKPETYIKYKPKPGPLIDLNQKDPAILEEKLSDHQLRERGFRYLEGTTIRISPRAETKLTQPPSVGFHLDPETKQGVVALHHIKRQSMHLFGEPMKAKSTMTQITNPFIDYQTRLLFGGGSKANRHLSPMPMGKEPTITTRAAWHNGLDNFLNLNKQRNDVKDGTLRPRPMTIYC